MMPVFLIVNAGSSSIKFALYDAASALSRASVRGVFEGAGASSRLHARDGAGNTLVMQEDAAPFTHAEALARIIDWLTARSLIEDLVGAGHRVVHGGTVFISPTVVTPEVLRRLSALSPMAPYHQPYNIAAIETLARLRPNLRQVACFDTAFHASQSAIATAFGLPRAMTEQGVRRYGFHGLSYEYIAGVLPDFLGEKAEGRIVVAHLGHGASMCAMRRRESVATTMGFSALDGLVMGTRCGSLDPGIVLYLLQQLGMSADDVSQLLYQQSGLLGVSGESDDMRVLLASQSARAREAIDLFVYRIARELGSLAAALGGLDALVFTAGIGEGSADVRARVSAAADWLEIRLDDDANLRGGPMISLPESKVAVLTLPTDEEAIIVRACRALAPMSAAAPQGGP